MAQLGRFLHVPVVYGFPTLFFFCILASLAVWEPPASREGTFSSLFASVLQDKTLQTVPEVPVAPLAHLPPALITAALR